MRYPCPPRWQALSHYARFDLAARADIAVKNSIDHACRVLAKKSPSEPDLVLSFFLHGLEQLESDWNARLSSWGLSVKLSGVFSHQTPKVEPQALNPTEQAAAEARCGSKNPISGTCELGDLMVIAIHDGMPPGNGNAIMLQAKKDFYHASDPKQRFLYEHANRFTYKRATPTLNGQVREMFPKDNMAYAYWDLDPSHVPRSLLYHPFSRGHFVSTTMFAADARIDRDSWESFGVTLANLVFGDSGEPFNLPASDQGWSKVVHDLLTVTSTKIVNSTSKVNVRGAERGRGTDAAIRYLLANKGVPIRNSLGDALLHLSAEFKDAYYSLESLPSLDSAKFGNDGSDLPPLREFDDSDEDGGSLLVVHCKNA